MADGAPMKTGASVARLAELECKSDSALAPTLPRLMVGRNVLDPTKRPGHVAMDHAKVGERLIS